MVADQPLLADALENLLLGAPLHLLYFDRTLTCRFAAPNGPHFLGQSARALLGQTAHGIFPATLQIVPHLQQVLATQTAWWGQQLPYPAGPNGTWTAGHWNVQAQPWTLASRPPAPRVAAAATAMKQSVGDGVLVSCLPFEGGVDTTAEGARSAVLLEGIRNQLTIIHGFAGLLRRRPAKQSVDAASAQIGRAVQRLTGLLDDYERETHLPIQQPDTDP